MTFNDLWDSIDKEKVLTEIGNFPNKIDLDACLECVYYACHQWLLRDWETISVDSIEEKKVVEFKDIKFKFVTDVEARFNGSGALKIQEGRFVKERSLGALKNKKVIIDWKSGGRALDASWVSGYLDSWQWRTYLWATKADVFIYRGVRRRSLVNGDLERQEIIIDRSEDPNLDRAVENQLTLLSSQRNNLIQLSPTGPWPMNRPTACYKWGYECPSYADCYLGTQAKKELDITRPVSYSRLETFMLCNERARREELAAMEGEDSEQGESANFGNSFHKGMAEIYRQVFKK